MGGSFAVRFQTRMVRRRAAWLGGVLLAVTTLTMGGLSSSADDRSARAEPWPRWRGRDGAGLAGDRSFPREWADADWAWTVALPGKGHASPVIWQDRIYTASADEGAQKRFVTCHTLAEGRLVWSVEIPGPIDHHHVQNSSASGSLATDRQGVYWMWAAKDGLRVEAFSHAGERLWHVDLGPYAAEHGFAASPAVWRDLLIVPNDQEGQSFTVALDTASGQERWRLPRESKKSGYATPLVVEAAGDTPLVVLASMAHGLTGIDPRTGRVLWERRCLPKRAVSSPVLAGGLVLGTCGEGGGDNTLVALQMPPTPSADSQPVEPAVAYQLDRSAAPYVPTPLCVGDRLFLWGDRGVVTCVAAATGEVVWRGRVGGTFSASPISAGDAVINISADGEVVAIGNGKAFELLGRRPLGEECRSTPAVSGSRMVLRTAGKLMALDAQP